VKGPSFDPFFQIFYVNTQTGQVSRDLPTETGVDVSGSDLAGFTASQARTRGGIIGRQGIGVSYPVDAGFGLSKHTEIPEPWVRKLADDGMSYYLPISRQGRFAGRFRSPNSNPHVQDGLVLQRNHPQLPVTMTIRLRRLTVYDQILRSPCHTKEARARRITPASILMIQKPFTWIETVTDLSLPLYKFQTKSAI